MHRGHGGEVRQDLRPRGVVAGPAEVSRDLLVQQLRGFSGAASASAMAQSRDRQARARAYLEWLWSRRGPHAGRDHGELSGSRRPRAGTRGLAGLHGRAHGYRLIAWNGFRFFSISRTRAVWWWAVLMSQHTKKKKNCVPVPASR